MVNQAERKVLDMVEQGQISAEEGLRLINAMDGQSEQPSESTDYEASSADRELVEIKAEEAASRPQIPQEELDRMKHLKRWWILPFAIGLLITTLGAIWMYMGYTAKGFGFGFWLAWIPFLLGILITAVSYQSSHGVWLHVRIKQKPGESPQRIVISLPIPLGLTRWVVTTFGDRIPGLKDQPVSEYSEILKSISPEDPFYVHVDEGNGEEVEVFIG
jgi:polyhydroxyalkanoate synthesis regulator phasin